MSLLLSNIPLLVLIAHFLFYCLILILSTCHYHHRSQSNNSNHKKNKIAPGLNNDNRYPSETNCTITDDGFDGNSTDIDMFYETKIRMEPLKTHNKQNSNHRYSENSNTNNWSRLDSITDGNNSSHPNTPKRNKVVMPDIPEITEEKYDINDHYDNNPSLQQQNMHNDNNNKHKQQCGINGFSLYLQLLLYIFTQSSIFGTIFVYISYSKCKSIIPSSQENIDLNYVLFLVSIFMVIFYKFFSSIAIAIITKNCKYFTLQWFDLLIFHQCFWSNSSPLNLYKESNTNYILQNQQSQNEMNIKLWIQQYLLILQSIFANFIQLCIAIVFLMNFQVSNGEILRFENYQYVLYINLLIVISLITTSFISLICFSKANVKIEHENININKSNNGKQSAFCKLFGFYLCRLLEISSRIILFILIWKYLNTFYLTIIIFVEFVYLLIHAIISKNTFIICNIIYTVIDVHGLKKSKFFMAYRFVTNYIYAIIITILSVTDYIHFIDFQNASSIPSSLSFFNATTINHEQNELYFQYLLAYYYIAQIIYQSLLFWSRYNIEMIKSIGQSSNFEHLLCYKCWTEIYELMLLGANYSNISKHNEEDNLLCAVCFEGIDGISEYLQFLHLKIADLYLKRYNYTFLGENKFYLPFYNAISYSTIRMIRLLISYNADIEHLFENKDWNNSLQCIIKSPKPSMNKIQFIIKTLQQRYYHLSMISPQHNNIDDNAAIYDDKIDSFLNYQNGNNYDTALLMLYWTNDYEMMDKGFDRMEAMEYLIWNGANPNIVDKNKCNILHYACEQNESRTIKMLVKNGVNIQITNGYRQSPLSILCRVKCDKLDILQLVIVNDADVNQKDKYGRTSMHYAACGGVYEVVQFLMDKGGDCTMKDHDGLTPLHYAIRYHTENEEKNNENNPRSNSNSNSPRSQLEEDSFIDVVMLLIMMGKSDINSVEDTNKCSLLHDASKTQPIEIIDYLIKIGANIYSLDKNGHSPKYYSLQRKNEKQLMEYWKEIYLNSDVYHEIMLKHSYNHTSTITIDNVGCVGAYIDDCDIEDDSLSNIKSLEAFKSIVTDEQEEDERIMNQKHDIINR